MVITSLNNERIKEFRKLNEKKYRQLTNLFLVEGEHLVLEAYKKGVLKTLIVLENNDLDIEIDDKIEVNLAVLKSISDLDTPQSFIGVCEKQENNKLGDRLLILDNIQDPGNLGTIIRSAVAFNIDTIILSNDTVDLYNSKVIRATQGMLFNINIIRKDLMDYLPKLHDLDYHIYGTDVLSGHSLKSLEKRKKFAIIMGNEGNGVKKTLKDNIDEYIYIDMNENCESLNVAIATSIILYEFSK